MISSQVSSSFQLSNRGKESNWGSPYWNKLVKRTSKQRILAQTDSKNIQESSSCNLRFHTKIRLLSHTSKNNLIKKNNRGSLREGGETRDEKGERREIEGREKSEHWNWEVIIAKNTFYKLKILPTVWSKHLRSTGVNIEKINSVLKLDIGKNTMRWLI